MTDESRIKISTVGASLAEGGTSFTSATSSNVEAKKGSDKIDTKIMGSNLSCSNGLTKAPKKHQQLSLKTSLPASTLFDTSHLNSLQSNPSGDPLTDSGHNRSPIRPDEECCSELVGGDTIEDDKIRPIQSIGNDSRGNSQAHPVMGIFFKVWSLVKVTKGRKHLKRQSITEDRNEFGYIPGNKLSSSANHHVLEQRHFGRSGSQVPSARVNSKQQLRNNQSFQGPGGVYIGGVATATSSSSGVSSTTSSANGTGSGGTSTRGPQLADARRKSPESTSGVLGLKLGDLTMASARGELNSEDRKSPTRRSTKAAAWASSIKRSVTSVNHADLLNERVARFRNMSHHEDSEGQNFVSGSSLIDHRKSIQEGIPQDEDDTSNDIYSTPADSIQSVQASSQPANIAASQNSNCPRTNNPLIKSFSSTNYSQLSNCNVDNNYRYNSNNNNQLSENGSNQKTSSYVADQSRVTLTGSEIQLQERQQKQRQEAINSIQVSNGSNNRRLNGSSRFFISSSSSEDSNSHQTQQLQRNTSSIRDSNDPNLIACSKQHENNQKVLVQPGVHYHSTSAGLVALRPDSLPVSGAEAGLAYMVPVFTPLATNPSGPSIAGLTMIAPTSMSPIVAVPSADLAARLSGGQHRVGPLLPSRLKAIVPPALPSGYKKSPSLFELSRNLNIESQTSEAPQVVGNKSPTNLDDLEVSQLNQKDQLSNGNHASQMKPALPNSISLYECKQLSKVSERQAMSPLATLQESHLRGEAQQKLEMQNSEYKLAQMLLESGSNPSVKDESGLSALMLAIQCDNLQVIKCLIEHGADPNDTDHLGQTGLDLLCSREPSEIRLEALKYLIDNGASLDRVSDSDGSRLLDRLIKQSDGNEKLPFIDCLLQKGAKLGSSTWHVASGKRKIQLRLLRKLCQDGYFLYKIPSIEAAVYRFEYALKRIAELECELSNECHRTYEWLYQAPKSTQNFGVFDQTMTTAIAARQIKYQTYLGLSRCERKRKFFKRALQFANLAILVDSTSYEGYYSKAHILKDMGQIDESLLTVGQTQKIIDKSISVVEKELEDLNRQEEELVFGGFNCGIDPITGQKYFSHHQFEVMRSESCGTLDYLREAKRYIQSLEDEIRADKAN